VPLSAGQLNVASIGATRHNWETTPTHLIQPPMAALRVVLPEGRDSPPNRHYSVAENSRGPQSLAGIRPVFFSLMGDRRPSYRRVRCSRRGLSGWHHAGCLRAAFPGRVLDAKQCETTTIVHDQPVPKLPVRVGNSSISPGQGLERDFPRTEEARGSESPHLHPRRVPLGGTLFDLGTQMRQHCGRGLDAGCAWVRVMI
jgi:hypothetical protein